MALSTRLRTVIGVVLIGVVAAFALSSKLRSLFKTHATVAERPTPHLELVPVSAVTTRARAGDPVLGGQLYAVHCVSCHGFEGRGDGPASTWLHPLARDHTSVEMAARSDERLFQIIDGGGARTDLSSLMPSFADRFDDGEAWALVAHLRTLHPDIGALLPDGSQIDVEPTLVRPERAKATSTSGIAIEGVDLRVDLVRAFTRNASGAEQTIALLAAERVPEAPSGLWVVVRQEVDGSISRLAVPRVDVLSGKGSLHRGVVERALLTDPGDAAAPVPVDVARLAASVRTTAAKLEVRFRLALEQRSSDVADAEGVYAKWRATPDAFSLAERTFQQNCATCHGTTGRGIGPNTTRLAVRPRNLADGFYMNALPDEHLVSMIRHGGGPMRHSGLMPGFGSVIKDSELAELVKFLRKLAIPAYTEGPHAHAH